MPAIIQVNGLYVRGDLDLSPLLEDEDQRPLRLADRRALAHELAKRVATNVQDLQRLGSGRSGYVSKGDLWDESIGIQPTLLFDGKNGRFISGGEKEDAQADKAYLTPTHSDGEFFYKSLHPKDIIDPVRVGRAAIGVIGADLLLNSMNDEMIADALSDDRFRLPYAPENRETIRAALQYYIERCGIKVLGFLGKPVEIRHIISKDAARHLLDYDSWTFREPVTATAEEKFINIYRVEAARRGIPLKGQIKMVQRNVEVTLHGTEDQRDADVGMALMQSWGSAEEAVNEPHGFWVGPSIMPSETALVASGDSYCRRDSCTIYDAFGNVVMGITLPHLMKTNPKLDIDTEAAERRRRVLEASRAALSG